MGGNGKAKIYVHFAVTNKASLSHGIFVLILKATANSIIFSNVQIAAIL